jgi:hypothetical protein
MQVVHIDELRLAKLLCGHNASPGPAHRCGRICEPEASDSVELELAVEAGAVEPAAVALVGGDVAVAAVVVCAVALERATCAYDIGSEADDGTEAEAGFDDEADVKIGACVDTEFGQSRRLWPICMQS